MIVIGPYVQAKRAVEEQNTHLTITTSEPRATIAGYVSGVLRDTVTNASLLVVE